MILLILEYLYGAVPNLAELLLKKNTKKRPRVTGVHKREIGGGKFPQRSEI